MKIFKLLLIPTFFYHSILFSQTSKIKELNKKIYPIEKINDFTFLNTEYDKVIQEQDIVALGEATHGTKEFFMMNNQIIKDLITNYGFKSLVFESDFIGTQVMNEYVNNKHENVYDGLFNMGKGNYYTEEFLALIDWVKEYNKFQESESKVSVYGCDMLGTYNSSDLIKEYIESNFSNNHEVVRKIDVLDSIISNNNYNKKQQQKIQSIVDELDNAFSGIEMANFLRQYFKVLKQSFNFKFIKRGFKKSVYRNKCMASNILWLHNFTQKEKMIFLAHNEHISKGISHTKCKPAGYYLGRNEVLNYYALGYDFYEGKVRAIDIEKNKYDEFNIPPSSITGSYTELLAKAYVKDYILNIRNLTNKNTDLSKYFHKKRCSRSLGARYYPEFNKYRNYCKHKIVERYDALIFIRETTAAETLKRK